METKAYSSMTCTARLRAVASSELMRTPATSGPLAAVHTTPSNVAIKGTSVPAIAARKANVLLPSSDVVVFDDLAGIRSWSPPV